MVYLPELSPVTEGESDCPYRAKTSKEAMGQAMAKMVQGIAYNDFPREVLNVHGPARASVYADVRAALFKLDEACNDEHPMNTANQIAVPFVSNHCAMVVSGHQVLVRTHMGDGDDTPFLHIRSRVMGHPQHALINHLYQVTGYEALVAIPCAPFARHPLEHWNYYIIPLHEPSERLASEMLHFKWVPIDSL